MLAFSGDVHSWFATKLCQIEHLQRQRSVLQIMKTLLSLGFSWKCYGSILMRSRLHPLAPYFYHILKTCECHNCSNLIVRTSETESICTFLHSLGLNCGHVKIYFSSFQMFTYSTFFFLSALERNISYILQPSFHNFFDRI